MGVGSQRSTADALRMALASRSAKERASIGTLVRETLNEAAVLDGGRLEQYIVIDSRKRAAWSYIRQNDGRFVLEPAENERIEILCEKLTLSFDDVYAGTKLDRTSA